MTSSKRVKHWSGAEKLAALQCMAGLGIVNKSGWSDWLANKYNYEMIEPLAREWQALINREVKKALRKHNVRSNQNGKS